MNYAVIFAGGVGARMGGGATPKQFITVAGKPVIIHTILTFENCPSIDGISVVCLESWIPFLRENLEKYGIRKVLWVSPGAPTGQQSIYHGLNAICDDRGCSPEDVVLINDGVRPFVPCELIDECIRVVREKGSAVTICPVPETIVMVPDASDSRITEVPNRSHCFLSKAPQGFFLSELMEAHHQAIAENRFDCTNSAELMMRCGHTLYTVVGSPDNIKITTPIDLRMMEALLDS